MTRKRGITLRQGLGLVSVHPCQAKSFLCRPQKKLRRLPHIFAKVIELPFHSDTDVSIDETFDEIRFIVVTEDVRVNDVCVHFVEFHPGIVKIVIRENRNSGGDGDLEMSIDELDVDLWQFRLPDSTKPEAATVKYSDGKLVVTVPKTVDVKSKKLAVR